MKEDPNSNSQGWPYCKEAKTRNLGIPRHRALVSEVFLSSSTQAAWPVGCLLSYPRRASEMVHGDSIPLLPGDCKQLQAGPWCRGQPAAMETEAA